MRGAQNQNLRIDQQRLWQSLMEMAKIGATEKGGSKRLALTDLDREGRDLFVRWCKEAGCAVTIDGEVTLLTGELQPDEYEGTVYEQIERRGIPAMLFEHFQGRLEYHSPWHHGRQHSHLFRGKVDVDEANALLGEHGDDDLRFLDNGAIGTPMKTVEGQTHAYHLVPRSVSKAAAVAAHARARGFAPEDCIAVGDSVEDLEVAASVGRFFVVANGPQRDPGLRAYLPQFDNVTVTEETNGDGFYEAVVSALMDR